MKTIIFMLTVLYSLLIFNSDHCVQSAFKVKDDYIVSYIKYKWIKWDLYCWIDHYSKKYKLPPLLVCAIIENESAGEKFTRGRDGEYGYMQVLPVHFRSKNIPPKLRCEPEYNIKLGCWYLGGAVRKAKGSYKKAIRLYNQGHYGKRWKYRNWRYVRRVWKDYVESLEFKKKEFDTVL
ncbi:MAG: lytic transglycosylase domain-containing protein [PVC group bacterium]|nr:lytic transglycosylase domain-containing protein [PVC group bacterium]